VGHRDDLDDLDALGAGGPVDQPGVHDVDVAAVDPDQPEQRIPAACHGKYELGAGAVLHRRRVHHDPQQQPEGVDEQVALTPADALPLMPSPA
jgi:hypothetical protein